MIPIILGNRITVFRDGGSAIYSVVNCKECGYKEVFEDNAIQSKTKGRFFNNKNREIDLTDQVVK